MDYPKNLFKYRKFDKYTINMLKTGSIYFCPTYKLDDPFECSIAISEKIKEGDFKSYLKAIIPLILKQLIISSNNSKLKRIDIMSFYDEDGLNAKKFKLMVKAYDKNAKYSDIEKAVDAIKKIEKMDEYPENFKKAIMMILNIQSIFGVFSMSEINDNQPMWSAYAKNYEGYCIEYDIEKFIKDYPKYKDDLQIVNYSDKRENDPIKIILRVFYDSIYTSLKVSHHKFDIKDSLIKLVTTKDKSWSYQKEWRFLAKAEQEGVYLPIKAIYLGMNMKRRNKIIILNIAKEQSITVYEQYLDYETSKIKFRKEA